MTGGDAQMRADIATYGWHVIKVYEDDEGPAFAFTIGLFQRFGHPELIVFGLPPDTMHLMLNGAGENVRAGRPYAAGLNYDDILEGYSCTFRPVPRRHYEAYLGSARWYYEGDDFPVLQLIWPDREHRYPWAAPPDAWIRGAQPVLADD
jgi:Domain of unknown function (DUF4262)